MSSSPEFDGLHILYALVPLSVLAVCWKRFSSPKRNPARLPFPPGPKPIPVIGNYYDIPKSDQWKVFQQWSEVYGDVLSFSILGRRFVVLNSAEAVTDLLERRSSVYSSRPNSVMVNDLMGLDGIMSRTPYGDKWRARRRTFHPFVQPGAVYQWEPAQLREVHAFLNRLLVSPGNMSEHVRHMLGALIMRIVYDIKIEEKDDPYTTMARKTVKLLSEATMPGAYLVESIPILRYIPGWFPGAGFQAKAALCKSMAYIMMHRPFKYVQDTLADGAPTDCMVAQMLAQVADDPDRKQKETIIMEVAGMAYGAGADTGTAAVDWFFLAMVLHPDVQQRAQAELDAVVGPARMPTYADRDDLPYIHAVVSEVLRWQPVAPVAVPHATTMDEEYRGFFIPAGSTILGNAWALLHDPSEYPDPEAFMPARFLRTGASGKIARDPAVRDPRFAAFGFGRRICPGRHLAEQSLWAVVASVLAVFSISPARAEDGTPDMPAVTAESGHLSHPVPFKCVIKPRSSRAEELIRAHRA